MGTDSRKLPIKVYNPFSVLYLFDKQKFSNYWFESGTPSFLITLLKKDYSVLERATKYEISADSLGTFDIQQVPLVPLLFQTGYLTFSNYDTGTGMFELGYPNYEVEESLKRNLIAGMAYTETSTVTRVLESCDKRSRSKISSSFAPL